MIVTKVPLRGYYCPDDDEIVWLFATLFYLPSLISPFKRHSGVKLWRHPSSHIREKISAGAHFCTKQAVLKQAALK
ncbi:hypothetical protein NAL19_3763 [Pectobacterium sp. F1-1]|nr:hypothetical protein NAL19_3763 [Pectobacterium sp. F1-1]